MRTAINDICIKDNKILLLKKGKVWILPGGKPEEGESDIECLQRENLEELPNAKIIIGNFYKEFIGKTPHRGDQLLAKTFFADIAGDITPAAELSESKFFSREDIKIYPISEISKKAIEALIFDDYLK